MWPNSKRLLWIRSHLKLLQRPSFCSTKWPLKHWKIYFKKTLKTNYLDFSEKVRKNYNKFVPYYSKTFIRAYLGKFFEYSLRGLYYKTLRIRNVQTPLYASVFVCSNHRYRRRKIDCSSLFIVPATSAAQNSLLFFFFCCGCLQN